MEAQGPDLATFDPDAAIRTYQALITELPPLNRQLLLYILDLLAVFASKSDLNKMTTANLAAIFQPGLLSHPQHDMAPQEYRLSQDVLIFLIENQDSFLIGMQGTAADERTVKEVQSGVPTPRTPSTPTTPGRSKTVVGRSSSNASAADSVRKWDHLRRNVSVSSKNSKVSQGGLTPVTPAFGTPSTGGSAVHRSNTVPSKRSAGASPRLALPRDKHSDPGTPSPRPAPPPVNTAIERHESQESERTPVATQPPATFTPVPPRGPEVTSASSSEATTPLAAPGSETSSAALLPREHQTPQREQLSLAPPSTDRREHSAERSASGASGSTRGFLDIFKQSPTSDNEGRRPNKLQKKRIPGSALSSAQSSAHDLGDGDDHDAIAAPITPMSDTNHHSSPEDALATHDHSAYATAQSSIRGATPQRMPTESTLRPPSSPTHSYHSHTSVTDQSDADYADVSTSPSEKPEKKRRWRFSHAGRGRDQDAATPTATATGNSSNNVGLGSLSGAEHSKSTISSAGGGGRPRASFQQDSPMPAASAERSMSGGAEQLLSDSEESGRKGGREKGAGPMSWIRGKIQERKEREAEKRAKTPDRNRERSESRLSQGQVQGLVPEVPVAARGKSIEVPREQAQMQTQPQAQMQTQMGAQLTAEAQHAAAAEEKVGETSSPTTTTQT